MKGGFFGCFRQILKKYLRKPKFIRIFAGANVVGERRRERGREEETKE